MPVDASPDEMETRILDQIRKADEDAGYVGS